MRQLDPLDEQTDAAYPQRHNGPRRRRGPGPAAATAVLVGGVAIFGLSIYCAENLDSPFDPRPRSLGSCPESTLPRWAEEEILGAASTPSSSIEMPPVGFLPVPLLAFAVLLGGRGLARRLAARERAKAARRRLGEPLLSLDQGFDDEKAVLSGQLVIEEGAAERLEDGAAAAAVTAITEASASPYSHVPVALRRRASRLVLRVGEETVPLCGEVEVVVGSVESFGVRSIDRLPPDAQDRLVAIDSAALARLAGTRITLRSVGAGDRVRVVGRLRRAAQTDEVSHYRSSATRWQMVGAEGPNRQLLLAFEGAPRPPRASGALVASVILGGVGTLLTLLS